MTKSIQQILEQERAKSLIGKVTEHRINTTIAAQARSQDPEWHKANTARYEDPNYALRVGKKISATYQTEEGRAKQSAKRHSQTEEAKEKIRLANIGLKKSDEIKAKLSVKKLGNRNHCKPIQTPLGQFPSKKEAALAYANQGRTNASKWIGHWLKTKPNEFYYLAN